MSDEPQNKAIVPVPVIPLVTPEKAAEQWRLVAVIIKGKLADQQIKELQTGSRWAFAKALEKKEKEKQPAT